MDGHGCLQGPDEAIADHSIISQVEVLAIMGTGRCADPTKISATLININFITRFSARFWASSVAGWKLYLTLLRRFCRAATLALKSSLPALA